MKMRSSRDTVTRGPCTMWLAEITLCCFLGVKALMVGQKEEPEKAAGSRKRTEQRRSPSGSFADEAVAAEKETCRQARRGVTHSMVWKQSVVRPSCRMDQQILGLEKRKKKDPQRNDKKERRT